MGVFAVTSSATPKYLHSLHPATFSRPYREIVHATLETIWIPLAPFPSHTLLGLESLFDSKGKIWSGMFLVPDNPAVISHRPALWRSSIPIIAASYLWADSTTAALPVKFNFLFRAHLTTDSKTSGTKSHKGYRINFCQWGANASETSCRPCNLEPSCTYSRHQIATPATYCDYLFHSIQIVLPRT